MKDKDPHLLTGTLKLYLREISDPLFPIAFYDKFAAASTDKNTVAAKLKDIVKELPKTVRISIAYMIGVSAT
jgi:SLIT-ROBO Rho GTPase activating protein